MASKGLTQNAGTSARPKLIKTPKEHNNDENTTVVITQICVPENSHSPSLPAFNTYCQKPAERVEGDSEKNIGLSFHIRPIQKEVVLIDRTLLVRAEIFLLNEHIIFDPIAKKILQKILKYLHRSDIHETKKVTVEIASMGAYGYTDTRVEKRIINKRIDERGNRHCSSTELLAFLIHWEPKNSECVCIHTDPLVDESSQFFPLIFIKEKIHPPHEPTQWLTRIDVAYSYPWGEWGKGVQWASVKK